MITTGPAPAHKVARWGLRLIPNGPTEHAPRPGSGVAGQPEKSAVVIEDRRARWRFKSKEAWTALPVPWAVHDTDRIPKQRYYDPEFFALEAELFWPRVWQMACRLEEIPEPGDFAEYEFLDQSIVVVRTNTREVKAYYNACRHRAVKLIEGHGSSKSGFVCPFHGWCFGLDGDNTYVQQPERFDAANLRAEDLALSRSGVSCGADAPGSISTTTLHRYAATASNRTRLSTTRGRSSRCRSSGGRRACSRPTGSWRWPPSWRVGTCRRRTPNCSPRTNRRPWRR